jgi:outer membrane DcaP-like protein
MKPNPMKTKTTRLTAAFVACALLGAGTLPAPCQSSELDQVKAAMETMRKNMEEMQKKLNELEAQKTAAPKTPSATEQSSQSVQTLEKVAAGQDIGNTTPVEHRPALNDQQEGAPRRTDYTLDPKYRGFIPIPNTPALIRFNAKPRVDVTSDNRNSGNPDRFVTAQIPVKGDANYGGSEQFNVNARGSSLSVDVRAPEMDGDFRFYYNNDFFGSGSGMTYRLKQLYGQLYNVTAGFTYSCFEDPDAWPDTVDFEGPNSVIFARRALIRYMVPFSEAWQLNLGVEAPGAEIDSNSSTNAVSGYNSAPDCTANVRWENAKRGHIQLGGVARVIGARGNGTGDESVFGWGVNLASSINVFKRDSFQTQLTYGEGIFRYFNDDFVNNDAAFDAAGDLKAIPAFGAMAAYTHHWSDQFRSTASFGYVNLNNEPTQGAGAYHETHYGSLNIVWQLRKHLSVGLEGLYGSKEVQGGASGDVWRVQLGMVYSLF